MSDYRCDKCGALFSHTINCPDYEIPVLLEAQYKYSEKVRRAKDEFVKINKEEFEAFLNEFCAEEVEQLAFATELQLQFEKERASKDEH